MRLDAERYRAARDALMVLCPSGKWKKRLLLLLDTDIRPPTSDGATGEGRRKLTWIWRMRPTSGDELEPGDDEDDAEEDTDGAVVRADAAAEKLAADEDLRAEWAKSLARAERWEEEVRLLKAEMVRSLKFFQCKSVGWLAMTHQRTGLSPDIHAGVLGYAQKQSYLCDQMARKYASQWTGVLGSNGHKFPREWPVAYRAVMHSPTQIKRRPHRQQAHIRLQKETADNMEVDEA